MSLSPDFLAAGIELAGDHGLVHGPLALQHFAIDGHAVAGPNPKTVADLNQLQRDFLVLAVGFQAARRLGSQFQQGADRAASLLAGAQFEHLAQQHKNGDHRRGLEISGDRTAHAVKSGWEQAGRKGRKEAVNISRTRAQGDQAEHVQAAMDDRRPGALEKRPSRP